MKRFVMIFSLLVFISGNLFAQVYVYTYANLAGFPNQIEKIDTNNNYVTGIYAIGKGIDTTHYVNVYRTYFEFLLSSIPTNATIDTVFVNYTNGGSGYSLKLTNVATISQDDLGANWAAIGNGSSLHTGLAYDGDSFMSNPIKTAIQNALSTGKIYIGALSESENTRGSQSSMLLNFDVYYKYPAEQLSITARNDLYGADGGNIGVGIYPAAAQSHSSPYQFNPYESQKLNLAAYDNQTVNGKVWFFNDTEYEVENSVWEKDVFGAITNLGGNASFTTDPLLTNDDGAVFSAFLKTTSYTTSGTMSSSEYWFTNATLTGDLTLPSGVTLTVSADATVNLNGYSNYIFRGNT